MSFVPFSNGIEVVFEFKISNQAIKNVLNFVSSSTPTTAIMQALGKALIDSFIGSTWWSANLGNSISFLDVKLTDLSSSSGAVQTVTSTPTNTLPKSPTSVNPSTMNNVALCVTMNTASRGRSYRGRMYLAGMQNSSLASPVEVIGSAATNAVTMLSNMLIAAQGQGCQLSVFSRHANKVQRPTGVATAVNNIACNVMTDSMRRRLEGRGI